MELNKSKIWDVEFSVIVTLSVVAFIGAAIIFTGEKGNVPPTKVVRNLGIAEEVAKVRGTTVHILKEGVCQGSGCIISKDGLIFTAKHVTDGGGTFIVTLDDGRRFKTIRCVEDSENDVAFLKIDPRNPLPEVDNEKVNALVQNRDKPLPVALLSKGDKLRSGDAVFIIGSPLGKDNINSVSLGIISYEKRNLDDRYGWDSYDYGWKVMFQSTAPAFPGNSGGPVFNMNGEVVGVLVAGQDASLNFSVKIEVFRDDVSTVRRVFENSRFLVPDEEEESDLYLKYGWRNRGNWHSYSR